MLGRLKLYLNQKAKYEEKTGNNTYGKAVYDEVQDIDARIEQKVRLVRNAIGKEVVSNTTTYTLQQVKPDDRLDGVTVIAVGNWIDKNGKICGYEVYT